MKLFYLFLILLPTTTLIAQDIKPLDYAPQYKKQKVRSRDCYEVRYNGNHATDSTHIGFEQYNTSGQLISYTEFFARGKKMAEYHYEYDENGKITHSDISLVFREWQKLDFKLTFDAKGHLIKRELPEVIPNFWFMETYAYNTEGLLIKSEQWFDINGTLKALSHKEYPGSVAQKENSLSQIYDTKGLLIIHQTYLNGRMDSAFGYSYTHY